MPATVTVGGSAAVTVAVTVTPPSGLPAFPPIGALTLSSSVPGDVVTGCILVPPPATSDVASCQATLTPASVGPRIITATFAGNLTHAPSVGTGTLNVSPRSTTTATSSPTVPSSDVPQTVVLTAAVSSSRTVDAGTVTFTVRDASSALVGAPVTSAPLTNGTATVDYILPGGTPPQPLTIAADYSGATDFAASGATGTLTVTPATPATPTIESVTPSTGPTSGGTLITITGTNFTAGPTVTVGGAVASNVVVVDATTITAETPPHAAGTVDVTVTITGAGAATRTGAFEYLADWRLTLARVGAGTGRVVSIAAGIACGETCSATFPTGATVELVAIPAADSTFHGLVRGRRCVDGRITLTSDVACTARFTRLTDKTTVDLDGDGLADVIGYAPPPAAVGSLFGGRALLAASAGVLRAATSTAIARPTSSTTTRSPARGASLLRRRRDQRHVRAAPLADCAGAGWRRPHRSRAGRSGQRRDPALLADRAADVPADRLGAVRCRHLSVGRRREWPCRSRWPTCRRPARSSSC